MNRDEFERDLHSRTLAYLPQYRADDRPVVVHLGDDTHTPNGHLLLVALVNQLARAHQHIVIANATDAPLRCPAAFGPTTVEQATISLARAINPFITATTRPTSAPALVSIAIGGGDEPVDLRVGCDGWCATFGPDARIDPRPTGRLGGMLASSLAAAYAFHRLLGHTSTPGPSYSLWDYGSPGTVQGPHFDGPLDVGRVLQVGAGGVGASLDYWLALLGVTGSWTICDGDLVDVSHLNRQLAFLATHAGFPRPPASNKAEAAAALLGAAATADPHWYGETVAVVEREYDVVVALANEHGARSALQARQPPVLLHSTTSANWEAQFHRHIAGRDDCIACRIPENAPRLRCSVAQVDQETSTDAALPFLSASAALLLLTGLARLQHGALGASDLNYMALNLGAPNASTQQLIQPCTVGCSRWAPPAVRQLIATDTRYAHLDPGRGAET
jgi:molybdopterin/thiamine biosynthesis adenylyltransferase